MSTPKGDFHHYHALDSKILRQFQMITKNSSYNKLLSTLLFPVDTNFAEYEPFNPEASAVKERFLLDVLYDDKLVFMLQHKAPQEIKHGSLRDNANLILRDRVESLRRKSYHDRGLISN
jgi:hypothetical protein